jgi:hypothetical protein
MGASTLIFVHVIEVTAGFTALTAPRHIDFHQHAKVQASWDNRTRRCVTRWYNYSP